MRSVSPSRSNRASIPRAGDICTRRTRRTTSSRRPGVRRDRVDVGSHYVRFRREEPARLRRSGVIDGIDHRRDFPRSRAVAVGDERHRGPHRGVRVLAAILADAWKVITWSRPFDSSWTAGHAAASFPMITRPSGGQLSLLVRARTCVLSRSLMKRLAAKTPRAHLSMSSPPAAPIGQDVRRRYQPFTRRDARESRFDSHRGASFRLPRRGRWAEGRR
jgi:hypothetical protein